MSASSAAATPGFPARSISPSAASAPSCLRRGASATVPPAATAGSSAAGIGAISPPWSGSSGQDRARLLWSLAEEAKALVRTRIARHGIACDLKPGIAIAAHRPRHARALAREAQHLRDRYGYDEIDVLDRAALRAEVAAEGFYGGLLDRGAGHLHPLDYARGLGQAAAEAGVDIREGSPVSGLASGAPCTAEAGGAHGHGGCGRARLQRLSGLRWTPAWGVA